MTYRYSVGLAVLLATGAAHAQDSRTVNEPAPPPSCTVLAAGTGADDTARIQTAIDGCQRGQAVRLSAGGFVAGPLTLRSGVSLLLDSGATLRASINPKLYDRGAGTCGTIDKQGRGCKPFITLDNVKGSGIYGEGVIDGQGGRVIDGGSESWWQLARRAQKEDTRQNVPRLIEITNASDITLHKITLRNSPNFHVTLNRVDGFTAWGVRIDTPADARNTDGIDPISSRNVTIAYSHIRTGDDNVAIKAGNNGPTENISILHNRFYSGHGMSIGSETNGGVRRVLVEDLSMDGTTSGLRIKSDVSRGGVVDQISYRNVCLRDVKTPIDISGRYDKKARGSLLPVFTNIRFDDVHSVTPGRVVVEGYDEQHPVRVEQRNVSINDPAACANRFAPFPVAAASPRPQLTPEQAKQFSYSEVLKYVGEAGKERIDPWDPLADPLAKGAAFTPDYIVDKTATADGVRTFNSVQEAVNRAVLDSAAQPAKRLYVLLKPGVYAELVYLPSEAAPITLYGEGKDAAATRITAKLEASMTGAAYAAAHGAQFTRAPATIQAMFASVRERAQIGTFGTQTVWAKNNGFQARNLTFENGYNKDTGNARAESLPNINNVHHQALALSVDGVDKAQFENVRLIGFQDTLFLKSPQVGSTVRSFFNKSYIEGDVDFIFGDSTAYFHQSELRTLGDRGVSYAAAPNTHVKTRYGFVFDQVRFTHEGKKDGDFYLLRQWFSGSRCTPYAPLAVEGYRCTYGAVNVYQAPTGTIARSSLEAVGKMVVLNSRIGPHINRQQPWHDWNKKGSISYRPAQYNSDDYWKNLVAAGIDPVKDLGYTQPPSPVDIFLGEFNNSDE
ncbi:pectin lyase fold-containing protein [Duganella sp. FT94W]|uniref:Pectin lyase fold-containing protein n=1 Tax=Duganella lactea TaxID=2692173 RepID=A0ABW9V4D5_9BURK|nr:pectinesterase family protein [Duganella lactea]MYM34128.1 pectin lyase fold-containing protein [Duganella lactea]